MVLSFDQETWICLAILRLDYKRKSKPVTVNTMTIKDFGRRGSLQMVQRCTRSVTFHDRLKFHKGPLPRKRARPSKGELGRAFPGSLFLPPLALSASDSFAPFAPLVSKVLSLVFHVSSNLQSASSYHLICPFARKKTITF